MTRAKQSGLVSAHRREFLRFLAASPYVAACGGIAAFLPREDLAQNSPANAEVIASPAGALDVFDFEEAARRNVQQGHWAYVQSGVDGDDTLRANREGFKHVQLRPRRLRDATHVDMRVALFGEAYDSPIFLCPTASQKILHPSGELGVASAAKTRQTLQMLSTETSTPIEDVNKTRGRPVWFQLYATTSWNATQRILERVEAAGCTVLLLTVDNTTGRFSETYLRNRPRDLTPCGACHQGEPGSTASERVMYDGIDMKGVGMLNPAMDWTLADRIRKFWKGRFIIKGIDTHEDARLSLEHGFDAILVSNHGGRSTETSRSTIEALPEIVGEVRGRVPVFVDSGFRRGTDVFKGLALGATAVGVGRPYLWGLGAFGQQGVERVIEILNGELRLAMGNCGTRTLADINRDYVATPDWKS